jgi:uncharacterized protein (DUF58 family)
MNRDSRSAVVSPVQAITNDFTEDFLQQLIDVARISMKLYTRAYVMYAVIAVLIFLGLFNRPVLWCGLACLAVTLIQYYRLKNLANQLTVERRIANPDVKIGEKVRVSYLIRNLSLQAHPPFLIRDMTMYLRSVMPVIGVPQGLPANSSLEIKIERVCEAPAGSLPLGPYLVQITDELGLFQTGLLYRDGASLRVHLGAGDSDRVDLRKAERSPLAGDLETSQSGHGISLYGVREYRDGDPLNSICWKKSAVDEGFFVKEFESDITRRAAFLLASEPGLHLGYGASSTWEVAKAHTLRLIRAYLDAQSSVSLITHSVQVKDVSGAHNAGLFESVLNRAVMEGDAQDSKSELELYSLLINPPCLLFYVVPYFPKTEATILQRMQFLKAEGFEPSVVFVDVGDSASQVSKRFGSFLELIHQFKYDLGGAVERFRAAGVDAYVVGAQDLNGRVKVRKNG